MYMKLNYMGKTCKLWYDKFENLLDQFNVVLYARGVEY